MTASQIISVVRDLVILGALGFILYLLHQADTNAAKVADLTGVEQQLTANAATQARYAKETSDAQAQLAAQVASATAAIAAQHAPVLVCPVQRPTSAGPLPGATTAAKGQPAATGGPDAGSGDNADADTSGAVDIRPAINAFELRYEGALATCRSVLAQWPK